MKTLLTEREFKKVMTGLIKRYRGLPREIYILFLARVINSIGSFVFPLLTLIMTDKIGFTEDDAGLALTILTLTQVPAMILGGKLADKFGRKKLIVVFQFLGAATYMVCGFVQPSIAMIVLVVVASNFYAVTHPAMEAVTADLTHVGNRKEAISVLYMGFNLGFAIGPMIGGLLYKDLLPLVFIGDAFTTIVSMVLVCVFIKETLPDKNVALPAATEENHLERHQEGSVFGVLLKRPVLIGFALIMLVYEFAYSQWAFALPIQMKSLFAEGAAQYGVLASFNGLLVIILTPLVTSLIRRWRVLRATVLAGVLFAFSFGMLIFVRDLPLFYIAMFILTLGEVLSTIDNRTFLCNYSPSSHRGRLNSLIHIISGTGRMISPLVIGQLIVAGGIASGWLAVAGAAFLGAVLLMMLASFNPLIKNQNVCMGNTEGIETM